MGEMTVGLVIAGVVVIGIVALAMRWRFASGEQQALRHYQNALDTLRTVSDRMESARPAVEPRSQTAPQTGEQSPEPKEALNPRPTPDHRPPEPGRRPPEPERRRAEPGRRPAEKVAPQGAVAWSAGTATDHEVLEQQGQSPLAALSRVSGTVRRRPAEDSRVGGEGAGEGARAPAPAGISGGENGHPHSDRDALPVIVFEEEEPVADPAPGLGIPAGPALPRASRRALQRSSRPPSRVPSVAGLILLVVVIVVLAYVFTRPSAHHTATPPVAHHHTTTPAGHHARTQTASSTTTSTTAPPTVQPVASTVSIQGATYPAPAGRYTVTLTSSGPCWVYATLASTGSVLWTGTLDQGQAQTLTGTGEIDVELGHANTMSETLNGVPVVYPAQYQAVFTMKFVPTTT